MSLETVAAMVESEAIDVQPQYQRRDRWLAHAKSALMESFLLNIPVPPVYLAEESFGTYSIIDGKQRLTAIKEFMRNEFPLKNLERFSELEGLKFSSLPVDLRNALNIRPYVRVVTLLKQSDPELKYEVFTRLNSGGIELHPQEVRNAMYRGKFNDLLIYLSSNEILRERLKIFTLKEDAYKTMSDVEYVLRFFTMEQTWKVFSGDYRRSMDAYMRDNRFASTRALNTLKQKFQVAIERCKELWGDAAFRRYDIESKVYRDQFLSALYDAQMIAVSRLSEAKYIKLKAKKSELAKQTKLLFSVPDFDSSIRISTNTPSKVRYRIQAVSEMLDHIG